MDPLLSYLSILHRKNQRSISGFTLIEMIIVIAILGVLVVVVIVAINPAERQAQARDAGRKSTVLQLGHALQSYYTSTGSSYPLPGSWAQDLLDYGELATFPSGIKYADPSDACADMVQPGVDPTYCYDLDATDGFLVYATAESQQQINKCSSGLPYFVFSSADARGGTICSSSEPSPWVTGSVTYTD